jgi:cytochrome c-type biogenesis protein CcmH
LLFGGLMATASASASTSASAPVAVDTSVATTTTRLAADPLEVERRTRALSEQLRCLVCQNQSIADSQAGLAVDLRNHVREKIGEGMSDAQVVDYVVQRYGDFVLYRPPFKSSTWLLWIGPLLLLALGCAALLRRLVRQAGADRATPADRIPPEQLAHAARLLDDRETR